jgi:hypothetical protein
MFLATLPGDASAIRKTAMETMNMVSRSSKNRLRINLAIESDPCCVVGKAVPMALPGNSNRGKGGAGMIGVCGEMVA